MSIIICPECNQQVSDKATTCIHCGYPLQKTHGKATFKVGGMGIGQIIRWSFYVDDANSGERLLSGICFKLCVFSEIGNDFKYNLP